MVEEPSDVPEMAEEAAEPGPACAEQGQSQPSPPIVRHVHGGASHE
jgi:hypothetical protein